MINICFSYFIIIKFKASYYYETLGKIAYLAGNLDEAIHAWERRTLYPHPGNAFLELAKVYFIQKDFDSGYTLLTKHLQSANKEPYNNIISDPAFDYIL